MVDVLFGFDVYRFEVSDFHVGFFEQPVHDVWLDGVPLDSGDADCVFEIGVAEVEGDLDWDLVAFELVYTCETVDFLVKTSYVIFYEVLLKNEICRSISGDLSSSS